MNGNRRQELTNEDTSRGTDVLLEDLIVLKPALTEVPRDSVESHSGVGGLGALRGIMGRIVGGVMDAD